MAELELVGICGFTLYSRDPRELAKWYKTHLGLAGKHDKTGSFHFFDREAGFHFAIHAKTEEFAPSERTASIGFYVSDLWTSLLALKAGGVEIEEVIEKGKKKSAWITDPEGNRVELKVREDS